MDLKTITATLALLGLGLGPTACGGEAKKDAKPVDATPVDAKPATPADAKPVDAKPVDAKPADPKAGEMACGEGKCGEGKCGGAKPADGDGKAIPVDGAAGAAGGPDAAAKPEDGKKT